MKKIERIHEQLKEKKIDALLITDPVNRYYLSGFTGSSGILLIGLKKSYLFTDFRYFEQASKQASGFKVIKWKDDLYQSMVPLIEETGWKKIGFEAKQVVYQTYTEMKEKLPVELVGLESTVEMIRIVKNNRELDLLRKGASELDAAFEFICSSLNPGMSEKTLSMELEIFLRRKGAEKPSFTYIVASGERGAMPHGTASEKVMQAGELVTIDYGSVFNHYATDITRTFSLGEPDTKQKEIYDIVQEAQLKARNSVKAGIKCSELDAVARDIISDAGYGDNFGHGLGHGIGLETHELPMVNHKSDMVLEKGMVITIEPGIYLPGWGGVRIEDMVLVTEDGCELLTKSTRELITI